LAPTTRYWPAYWRARARLGRTATVALDEQLIAWMIGLVEAEMAGETKGYPGVSGRIEGVPLGDFELVIRVRLDKASGTVEHVDFFDMRERSI